MLHFVGFKDERYWNAVKTFGKPDLYIVIGIIALMRSL